MSGGTEPLRETIEGAQSSLARAIAKAHLTGDPVGVALGAMSETLGAQLSLHEASTWHLRDVSARLDLRVIESLAIADKELASREAEVIAKLVPEIVKQVGKTINTRLWAIKIGTIAGATGLATVLTVAAITAGYGLGKATGQVEWSGTRDAIVAAERRDGPAAAALWARLATYNDPRAAMAECRKAITTQGNRQGCLMPVWIDPPTPPARP